MAAKSFSGSTPAAALVSFPAFLARASACAAGAATRRQSAIVAISNATNLRDRKGLTVGWEVMANLSGHPQLPTSLQTSGGGAADMGAGPHRTARRAPTESPLVTPAPQL